MTNYVAAIGADVAINEAWNRIGKLEEENLSLRESLKNALCRIEKLEVNARHDKAGMGFMR